MSTDVLTTGAEKPASTARAFLPAASHAMRWVALGKVGRIIRESLPGGKSRIRIDFGRRGGKRIRLDSVPSPLDGRPIPLRDAATAGRVLESVPAAMADGKTLEQALWPFRAKPSPQDLVQVRIERWIEHLEELVNLGKRSPTYLREIRRYARSEGHFSWWSGRPIHGITYGDVEDWHLWLARREIAAKDPEERLRRLPGVPALAEAPW